MVKSLVDQGILEKEKADEYGGKTTLITPRGKIQALDWSFQRQMYKYQHKVFNFGYADNYTHNHNGYMLYQLYKVRAILTSCFAVFTPQDRDKNTLWDQLNT